MRLAFFHNDNPGTTLNKLSEVTALREKRLEILRSAMKKHPDASGRELEKLTGINRKMIYKLTKKEGLGV